LALSAGGAEERSSILRGQLAHAIAHLGAGGNGLHVETFVCRRAAIGEKLLNVGVEGGAI
jgi:hypothetical protein